MLETMLALKNNDMRKIPGYDPEPVERLRKAQRALVRRGPPAGPVLAGAGAGSPVPRLVVPGDQAETCGRPYKWPASPHLARDAGLGCAVESSDDSEGGPGPGSQACDGSMGSQGPVCWSLLGTPNPTWGVGPQRRPPFTTPELPVRASPSAVALVRSGAGTPGPPRRCPTASPMAPPCGLSLGLFLSVPTFQGQRVWEDRPQTPNTERPLAGRHPRQATPSHH